MIRRLRLKFVCIVMAVVTLMLCAIFAMVFYFTSRNLERESLGMMQAVAQNPMRLGGNILAMSRRMRGLVEGLLELARVDAQPRAQELAPLDLSALTASALLPFEPLFYERGLSLESELEPGIHVRGSEEQLVRCLGILLDNAQKYSSPQGGTLVRLRRQGRGFCLLSVENSGVPLSPAQQRDIFKRFYRADGTRSGGSYGLGLAIARGIAEAHGGRIWAEAIEGGNRFCLRLRVQK